MQAWLTGPQADLFGSMPRADQRHGLDVVAELRRGGQTDHELLLAGLLHDCAKGHGVGLWHRVAWSLGERYGDPILRLTRRVPGVGRAFDLIRTHADRSAELALAAGCSTRTADLIRHQAEPRDPILGEALRLADERS